jgi:predicted  nucleic acid-binding Zn-ribbon protein
LQDLTNLLEYQKNALQVQRIESKFKKSKLRQDFMRTRKYLMDSQNLMKKHDTEAQEISAKFEAISKNLDEAIGVLDDINDAIENFEEDSSMKEIKMLQRNAKEQQALIKNYENDIKKIVNKLKKINSDLEKMAVNVPRAKKDYNDLKKLYDAELSKVNEQTLPMKKEMITLEKTLDKAIVKKYNQIAKSHPVALVEMKGRMCMGCNMELPAAMARRVAEADNPLECENCGRLLFVKSK